MHVSCLPPPYFDNKTILYKLVLLLKNGGESPETCKRAFQGLKRLFMHVSGLPPSKYGGGET